MCDISRRLPSSEALIGQWLEIKGYKMGVSQLLQSVVPAVCSLSLEDGVDEHGFGLEAINKHEWRGQLAAFSVAAGKV